MTAASPVFAGSATWKSKPTSGDWNDAENWDPETVPNGPSDVATFTTSDITNIFLSANIEVSQIVFPAGASAYDIATSPGSLTISGAGLTNTSGETQSFDLYGLAEQEGAMTFDGNASAGSGNVITIHGGSVRNGKGGHLFFNGTSSAGSSTIVGTKRINNYGVAAALTFADESSAGTAAITAADYTLIEVFDTATTNHATISLDDAAQLAFFDPSTSGSATINVDPGRKRPHCHQQYQRRSNQRHV